MFNFQFSRGEKTTDLPDGSQGQGAHRVRRGGHGEILNNQFSIYNVQVGAGCRGVWHTP